MKTRYKYLGKYYTDIVFSEDENEDPENIFINEEDESDTYPMDLFMLVVEPTCNYNGIMSETNTSAIVCKLSDCGEQAKLWRIY